MPRSERSVCYFSSRLPNLKLTVHHATLRSHAKALLLFARKDYIKSSFIQTGTLFVADTEYPVPGGGRIRRETEEGVFALGKGIKVGILGVSLGTFFESEWM